ncbi:MAG TPA: glycoside hydrolase family 30 beta sandwich domain-containing protein [Terriglobia bacterium]|nr:glycoside hydrolase family 30 beta sandwich domain-containing protein [Terriglobia bacterium]
MLLAQSKPILISPEIQFQRNQGFGITVGNGAAKEMNTLSANERERLIELLFGVNGARINILRSEIWWTGKRLAFTSYLYLSGLIYDFSDEQNETAQYSVVREAQKRNEMIICNTVWTPPPQWKDNNSPVQGGELLAKSFENYADYLFGYMTYYKGIRNLDIRLMGLQNAPDQKSAMQSCLWTPAALKDFAKLVARRLKQGGFSPQFLLPEVEWEHALDYLKSFWEDPDARPLVSYVGVHSNLGASPVRSAVKDFVQRNSLRLWISEFAMPSDPSIQPIESALGLAETMVHDLTEGDCNAWVYWVPVASQGWAGREGLIDRQGSSFKPNKRFWCLSQFSRFIPRDAVRISTSTSEFPVVAFRTPEYKGVVLVIVNPTRQQVTQEVETRGWTMERVAAYRTSEKEDGSQIAVTGESGAKQSFVLEPRSVTTILAQIRRTGAKQFPG